MTETLLLEPETTEDGAEKTDMTADVDPEAPYGWTTDPVTKERRPKKAPGRPRNQPDADDLARQPPIERQEDRAPERPKGHKPSPVIAPADAPPMPRGGVINKGVNKLYRRTGKLIRGMEHGDPMGIGQAFIECARPDPETPEDERELTVGEAWEQLAKNNPRIRAFLLKVIAGGDVGDLVMAHVPIGIAFGMKPWVQKLIPFGEVVDSMTEPDADEPEGTAMPAGLTRDDVGDMQELAMKQARQMARRAGVHVTEAQIQEAAAKAAAMAADSNDLPAGLRRQQPKRQSRAQRTGAR